VRANVARINIFLHECFLTTLTLACVTHATQKKIFQWVANFHYDQLLQQLTAVPNPGQVLIVWVVCGIMASLVVIM
jgi:hypothetical protein